MAELSRLDEIYQKSLDCVHCGLCLSACPTYLATGQENASPRGRIYLMRGVVEGRIPLAGLAAEEAFRCVGCRACETACPSGVEYGSMLELMREEVDQQGLRNGWPRSVERFALRQILPKRWRLHALVSLLGLAQRSGLDRFVLSLLSKLSLLPESVRHAHGFMPDIPSRRARRPLPIHTPAIGERRGCVAFLAGCVMHEIFPDVNRATVRVLAENGYDVLVPRAQGCCGALHAHSGDSETAHRLAARNAAAFAEHSIDALVVNSAGCGTALREAEAWIGEEGRALAEKVRDVCEFLDEVGLRFPENPNDRSPIRICYDDPCHLIHTQGVAKAPRRLLESLPGVELVAHENPDHCCGAAGIYNLTQRELSGQILEEKMNSLAQVNPDLIATGNPGCMMQLRRGVEERGMKTRVQHPIELIAALYPIGPTESR
ncbi:MAG: (Fe-S)-binding protein [Myxococcales bacterium]|nr:(Fe-S)-binding protein [Myxococcales bacterium]